MIIDICMHHGHGHASYQYHGDNDSIYMCTTIHPLVAEEQMRNAERNVPRQTHSTRKGTHNEARHTKGHTQRGMSQDKRTAHERGTRNKACTITA